MGCENVMIQILVSLIEWFAVTGLSVLGITYSPPSACHTPEPTEYRQVIAWNPGGALNAHGGTQVSSRDCIAGAEVKIYGSTPVFVTPSDRYDS
ncbi:hypothetical protein SAMN04488568_1097 [Maricaulis salignorans]|uniref:Uncharacterized protein n=2 Tax=Maricaulis salignorans TaxID=144026 RepID=A0A1G9S9E7_9PROT|nr:hypothetical protein SAMN04488568_1097 [Maricaulis salignorans]